MPINFGTDGWRAVISDTFTFHNLRLVTQAIADAIHSGHWHSNTSGGISPDPDRIVVGFDTRFLSDRYARDVARVMAANGYTVFIAQADSSTPSISYAVKNLNAIAGIVITASHNAPRYNGVKIKTANGCSASLEQSRQVEIYLNDNQETGRGPNLMEWDQAVDEGLIVGFNPVPEYFQHLRTLINFDAIAANPPQVVVDSMHGSGRGMIKGILTGTGCEVQEIRGEMNPGFGGAHPEPIGSYLGALAGAISTGMGNLGLALDGDADRIGAMDERGNFVDPHKIMSLAFQYLIEKRGWKGPAVRTVSTTKMIDRLAAKYELPVYETPVGFNHIADYMISEDILIGGEESGGISFRGNIPEGDGVLMGLLLIEMIAVYQKSLHTLVNELLDEVGPAYYERKDQRLKYPIEKRKMVQHLIDNQPEEIGGIKVNDLLTVDGVKYIMEDDSWLLIRPSGTEPVLRVYAEGRSEEMVQALLAYGETVAESIT
ncbi:MAG: phosphoglucomutase/phosphomannomutase family protein [Anaerolineales bacterium]|nr:phosphoglucomutase/phosphomannomutase family protein [Anaerolineales bacterium]